MIIHKLKITKEKLKSIPEGERIFFLQIMNLLTDINVLQKQILYSFRHEDNDVVTKGQNCMALLNLSLLAGKLREGWELLQKFFFGSQLSREYEHAMKNDSDDLINGFEALEYLKTYFNAHNLISSFRNEYAFHYGAKDGAKKIDGFKFSDQDLGLYMSKSSGNTFSTTNSIFINHLLKTPTSDSEENLRLLIENIIKIAKYFQDFIFACLILITEKYFTNNDLEETTIPDPPELESIHLPFFVADKKEP